MGADGPRVPQTREALVDVAYAVGALVNSVQHLATAVSALREGIANRDGDPSAALAASETSLAEANRTANASIAAVVSVLTAFGERPPDER